MDPLFGSETRGRVLAQLAQVPHPQTAYRIARAVGAEPIQVIRILTGLTGLVEHSSEGWILTDELLRAFLRSRSAREAEKIRGDKDELLLRFGLKTSAEHRRRRTR